MPGPASGLALAVRPTGRRGLRGQDRNLVTDTGWAWHVRPARRDHPGSPPEGEQLAP